jgi:hypothetical protein
MAQNSLDCEDVRYNRNSERSIREHDYLFALARARRDSGHRLERGYKLASHFAEEIAKRHRSGQRNLKQIFDEQVKQWKDETGHWSSVTKAIAHPCYLRIIGLSKASSGREIERLLLRELESDPDHWFAALTAVTGQDPVTPEQDFDKSVNAWLEWGRTQGIIER